MLERIAAAKSLRACSDGEKACTCLAEKGQIALSGQRVLQNHRVNNLSMITIKLTQLASRDEADETDNSRLNLRKSMQSDPNSSATLCPSVRAPSVVSMDKVEEEFQVGLKLSESKKIPCSFQERNSTNDALNTVGECGERTAKEDFEKNNKCRH